MTQVFALKNDKSWQSALLHENQILLINKNYKTQEEFLLKYNDKSIFRSTKAIVITSINQITHLEKDAEYIKIKFNNNKSEKLVFQQEKDLPTFCNLLVNEKTLERTVTSLSKFKAIQNALIGVVVSIVVGWFLHQEASILEAGGTIEITGRRKLFKEIFAKAAEVLGTKGSLIAAAIAVAFFCFLMFKKLKTPPNEVVYQ